MSGKQYTLEIWQGPPATMQSLGYGPLFTGGITIDTSADSNGVRLIDSSYWDKDVFLGVTKSTSDPDDIEEDLIKGYTNTGYYHCIPVTNKISNGVFIDSGLTLDVRKFYYPDPIFTNAPQIDIAISKNQEQLTMEFYDSDSPSTPFKLPKYYNYADGSKVPCSISYINLVGDTKVEGGITLQIFCWNNDDSYGIYGFGNCSVVLNEVGSQSLVQSSYQSLLNGTRMTNYMIPTVMACGMAVGTFYLVQNLVNNNNKSKVGSINKNVTFTQSYIPKVIQNDGVPKNLLLEEKEFPGTIKFL